MNELHSILTFGQAGKEHRYTFSHYALLSYIMTDVLSSESTTFPYDAELTAHALRIVDKLKRMSLSFEAQTRFAEQMQRV